MRVLLPLLFLLPRLALALPTETREEDPVLITIPALQEVIVETLSNALPDPSAEDMDRGFIDMPGAIRVTVSSNTPWRLVVYSDDKELRSNQATAKPLSHVLVCARGCRGHRYALSRTPQELASSSHFADHEVVLVDLRMVLDWLTDDPGDYQVGLRFKLEQVEG